MKLRNKIQEEWDDYEPLIKDEKIRKAVRAWSKANNITQVIHDGEWNSFKYTHIVISFNYDFDKHDGLKDMGKYTIDELCGEEEKPRPVIVNGIEYDSYADYLKSREEEE